ncbi:hypothetical protein MRX96_009589 [Rhipicephalus microplus]
MKRNESGVSRFGSFFRRRTLRRIRDSTDNDVSSLRVSARSRCARACGLYQNGGWLWFNASAYSGGSFYLRQPPAAAVCVGPSRLSVLIAGTVPGAFGRPSRCEMCVVTAPQPCRLDPCGRASQPCFVTDRRRCGSVP